MANLEPVTHVIFDLDGTLLDTESIASEAMHVVTRRYGKEEQLTLQVELKMLGYPLKERANQVWNDLQMPVEFEKFLSEVINECIAVVGRSGLRLMPGAEKLVKNLHKQGIPMAIASGNTRQSFDQTVARFDQFLVEGNYFHHVVLGGDDSEVKNHKPQPDIYLVTAKRFDPPPKSFQNVLVFEDTMVGAEAALSAGMRCVLVPDSKFGIDGFKESVVIESMDHFQPKMFGLSAFQ